ncbi:MAG: hypothetical protein AAGD25_20610 [Cyanobacteria bacterium P01_F01_bin.150]
MKSNSSGRLDAVRPFWPQARDFGPLPVDYQFWTAEQKQQFLWKDRILPSKYQKLPPLKPINMVGLLRTALYKTKNWQSDEVPTLSKKNSHVYERAYAHGSVAKIKFVSAVNTPFTGLFEEADYGFLRMSLAGEPGQRRVVPKISIKLLVDSRRSENVSALVSFTGQGRNYNVLAHEFSNIVALSRPIGSKLLNLIFMRLNRFLARRSLQNLAVINQYGEPTINPQAPYQIFLVPNPNIRFVSRAPHDFRNDMAKVDADTRLFKIYALDPQRGRERKLDPFKVRRLAQCIGYIDTTSKFVASFYGDRYLSFQNQRFRGTF